MAILRRCCCFDNVRSGSIASAIYSLVYSIICVAYSSYSISLYVDYTYYYGTGNIVLTGFVIAFLAFLLVASILALIGVSKDRRGFLVPYMVAMPLLILMDCVSIIYSIVFIAEEASAVDNPGAGVVASVIVLVIVGLFILLNIFCFLCVVSQYQELRDGRGRLQDILAFRSHQTTTQFVTAGPTVGGAVVVTQVGGAQPMGYPAQQQGYPPAQQGYPPAQQGYHPAQQGYPPAQQGYPPQPQGYPQAQRDDLPSNLPPKV